MAGNYWTATTGTWNVNPERILVRSFANWDYTNPYQLQINRPYLGLSVRAVFDDGNFEIPAEPAEPDPYNGHEYVNMGHDLVWATANVGAANEYEFGDYFMWGEIAPNNFYGYQSYKFMNEIPGGDPTSTELSKLINKYQIADGWTEGCWYDADGGFIGDGKTSLEAEDDAAAVNMGGIWRMPTKDEYAVLLNTEEYDWEWVETDQTYYDAEWQSDMPVEGFKVTCKIAGDCYGNSIFLPAAGRMVLNRYDTGWGTFSGYWTSSLCDDTVNNFNATVRAYQLQIDYDNLTNTGLDCTLSRVHGYVVRGVAAVVE